MTFRHNHIQNRTANLLTEFCKDVRVGPKLQPLSSEIFPEKTVNRSDNNASARGLWWRGQENPAANQNINKEFCNAYEVNKKENKKLYNECILQVEHGTFTPLVMSATGIIGRGIRKFYALLSVMIYEKKKTKLCVYYLLDKKENKSFALANSLCTCLRGSGNFLRESVFFISRG